MDTTRTTRIDDLTTLGHELTEEHLALAAGGLPKITAELSIYPKFDFKLDI